MSAGRRTRLDARASGADHICSSSADEALGNVTRQIFGTSPRYYLTAASPCPYLEGKRERKAFLPLRGPAAASVNDQLTHAGFRRSQNIAYRPACDACQSCVSARVVVDEFKLGRRWRKVVSKNADLTRSLRGPEATEEQFWLLRRYVSDRHGPGGMADMTLLEFAAMVEHSPVRTHIIEYRYAEGPERGDLAAFALVDLLADGFSLVYSAFDSKAPARSLGSFVVLDHIDLARQMGLPHVYLGYWVRGSDKMDYKAQFQPLQLLRGGAWRPFTDTDLGERAEKE